MNIGLIKSVNLCDKLLIIIIIKDIIYNNVLLVILMGYYLRVVGCKLIPIFFLVIYWHYNIKYIILTNCIKYIYMMVVGKNVLVKTAMYKNSQRKIWSPTKWHTNNLVYLIVWVSIYSTVMYKHCIMVCIV